MSKPILDLEVCDKYFFSSSGNTKMKLPMAFSKDHGGVKWVEYKDKRCKLVDDFPPYTVPMQYAKSGRHT